MTQPHEITVARDALELLLAEIARYLDAVEAFRREGREPTWRSDVVAHASV